MRICNRGDITNDYKKMSPYVLPNSGNTVVIPFNPIQQAPTSSMQINFGSGTGITPPSSFVFHPFEGITISPYPLPVSIIREEPLQLFPQTFPGLPSISAVPEPTYLCWKPVNNHFSIQPRYLTTPYPVVLGTNANIGQMVGDMRYPSYIVADSSSTTSSLLKSKRVLSNEGPNENEIILKKKIKMQDSEGLTNDFKSLDENSDSEENPGVKGEKRLNTKFENFGTLGKKKQTFGKQNMVIPDGMVSRATVYHQPWIFEIHHGKEKDGFVLISWKVTNEASGTVIERVETVADAKRRITRGWTISNAIFREAMETRAKEMENELKTEKNPLKIANIRSLIQLLRPRHFSEGLLVFGLQHRTLQEKMVELESRTV